MDTIGVFVVLALVFPIWMVLRETREQASGRYWQRVGVVVRNLRGLDRTDEVIGRYMNSDIYRSIVFQGIQYEFDRVAPPAYKRALRGRELYLEPGLVYVNR
jgi:hypothetical protein